MSYRVEWQNAILRILIRVPVGTVFTSDAIRVKALERNIENPPHPNAWGSVFRRARKDGLIEKTGRYFPSEVPSRHRSVSAEWRRI